MDNSIGWTFLVCLTWDAQNTPQGGADGKETTKNTIALRNNGKIASLCFLCHCKYRMKEYTMKLHLYFNVYYII